MKYLEYLKNKKVIYILFLGVICLLPFVLSDTYAKFISGFVTGEDMVEMSLDFDIGISSIDEYHEIKVMPNSALKFNVEVKNGSDSTAYYGIWYKMVSPTELPSDKTIQIGKIIETDGSSSGELATEESKTASFAIVNWSLSEVIVYVGVSSSATNINDIEYLNGKKLISGEVMIDKDIQITSIMIDGEASEGLPTTGIYTMTYSCSKGSTLTWDTYDKSITYKKGSKAGDKCSVEFTSSTDYKLLSEMPVGSYVEYVGAGGSVGSSTVSCKKNGSASSEDVSVATEAPNSCLGQNVREDLDDSNYTYGYTSEEAHKFLTTGWRLAYVSGNNPVIVSAGSPETVSYTSSQGNASTISVLNTNALKYCNSDLVDGDCSCLDSNSDGLCDSASSDAWAINDNDFYKITGAISGYGKRLTNESSSLGDVGGSLGNELYCVYKNSFAECGYNNDLLDNGGTYWFSSPFSSTNTEGVVWQAGYRGVHDISSGAQGLRPVIKLSKRVAVTGGAGTKEDPYKIEIIEVKHNDFAEKYMKPVANSDASIDFSKTSEQSGTNGVYYIADTLNEMYPTYYYRGNVNNNLIFADTCWKVVRTTETGGLKLIYNGLIKNDLKYDSYYTLTEDDYNIINLEGDFAFDASTLKWEINSDYSVLEFNVLSSGDFLMSYILEEARNVDSLISIYINEMLFYEIDNNQTPSLTATPITYEGEVTLSGVKDTDIITILFESNDLFMNEKFGYFNFSLKKGEGEKQARVSCDNTGTSSQIGTKAFNSSYKSPAYVGYMYGDVYEYTSKSLSSDTTEYVYGNDVSYANGTYTLTDTTSGAWSNVYSSGLNNYHYTCFTTGTTCTSVYYVYYTTSSSAYYITLNNGVNIETALSNMLDKNTTSSTIKGSATTSGTIDYWYYTNIEEEYKDYVEDTVWCNDRSIYSLGGWNPDGGTTSSNYSLDFGGYGRAYKTDTPDLTCARDIDKFTVSEENGNGDLEYPVGLLTADEIMLAGAQTGRSDSSYYLHTGQNYWSGSPYGFGYSQAYEFYVSSGGVLAYFYVNGTGGVGVRPSLSLKRGFTIASGGDGSTGNPYVVE